MGSYVEKRISNRDRLLMVEEYVNAALMENKIFTASDVAKAIYNETDYIDYKSLNKYIYADLDALKTAGYDFVTVAGKGYRILSRPDKLAPLDITLLKDCINGADALADMEKDALKFKLSSLGTKQEENANPLFKRIEQINGFIGKIRKGKHISPKLVRLKYKVGKYVDVRDYPFVKEVPQEVKEVLMVPYEIYKTYYLLGYWTDTKMFGAADIRQIISIEYVDDFCNYSDMDIDKYFSKMLPKDAKAELVIPPDEKEYRVELRIPKNCISNFVNVFGRPERKRIGVNKYIIKENPEDAYSCLIIMEFYFDILLNQIVRWSLMDETYELIGSADAIKEKERILKAELARLEKPV